LIQVYLRAVIYYSPEH